MASLTGQTIASTYDALLKITDNGPITASLKQITDGLGNNTPLYLSATTVFVDGNFRAGGAFYDGNNSAGTAGQFLVSTGTGVDWQNISESNLISGTGTNGFISKFTASGVIANSVIQESGSNIGIGISPTQKLHVSGNGLFTGTITASNVSGSTSGSNTGDETNASIKTKLGAATAVNDGYLTAVDYELFTNKVPLARTITINGDTQDLSTNRTFNVNVGVTSFNTRTGAVVLSSSDVTTALGYTPAINSRIMTINGVGYDLSADRSWSVGTVTSVGTSAPLTGGTITGAGTIGITQSNASTDGYLSSTDWNTFNNKQDALGFTPENSANKGIANGYASLDGAGKVPSTQLPSYVDDVVEVANFAALPATGETGKIYITLDTNFVYRWSGSVYVKISEPNAVWGSITGTLSNQTDLQSALNGKVDNTRTLTINGVTSDLSANRTFSVGTVTSVSGTGSVSGLSLSGSVTGSGSLTLGGTLSLTSSDVTTGLGYTPVTNARTLSINGTAFDLTANRSWNVGTVTSVGLELGTTGTDANISNSPITSSGNITLNLPTASASNRGLLSSTDWSTFNAKQNALTLTTTGNSGSATLVGSTLNIPTYTLAGLGGQPLLTNPVTGTGTSGYLTRFTGTTTVGNSVIFDNGSQIGIGTNSPSALLHLQSSLTGTTTFSNVVQTWRTASGRDILLQFSDVSSQAYIGYLSGDLYFGTGGANERMRITSGGNVGIGLSNPTSRLDVSTTEFNVSKFFSSNTLGQIWVGQSLSANRALAIGYDSSSEYGYINIFGQSAGSTLNFKGSNVGIGTTAPSRQLDVSGFARFNSGGNYMEFTTNVLTSLQPDGAHIRSVVSADSAPTYSWTGDQDTGIYNPAANTLAISTGASERMRITSAGNTLIGNTADYYNYRLQSRGAIYSYSTANDRGIVIFPNQSTPNIQGLIPSSGSPNNIVLQEVGGNVGIGTSSPQERLDVVGGAVAAGNGTIRTGITYSSLGLIGTFSNHDLGVIANGSERMRITSGGRLLVGVTNDTGISDGSSNNRGISLEGDNSTVAVQRNNDANIYLSKATGYSSGDLINFYVSGVRRGYISTNGTSVSYNTSSDYRLKEDLRQIKGLDKLSKIKVYDFKWKGSDERMDGVIAHELQEVIPYAVTGDKDDKQMQAVDYSKLVPILVKAIQELTEKVNQLENR